MSFKPPSAKEICFLNTANMPLGECCTVSETCEMLTFLMGSMLNEKEMSDRR